MLGSIPNDFKRLSRKLMEVTKVQSLTSVAPSPPGIIPQTLPVPSMTAEPESPSSLNEPDFEFLGSTQTSFRILPGWPLEYVLTRARMMLRRPTVRLDEFPFFMTIMMGSLSWSLFLGFGMNISSSETRPKKRRRRLPGYLKEERLAR